jgi:small conductance mechanosensitive channel
MIDYKKKRTVIIATWALFLCVLILCFFLMENTIYDKTAQRTLVDQANGIMRQMPSIVSNEYNAQIAAIKVQVAKLRSLALALERYDNIKDAEPFLQRFEIASGIISLTIYDREGNVLFGQPEYDANGNKKYTRDKVQSILDDEESYRSIEYNLAFSDDVYNNLLSVDDYSVGNDSYFWGVGDRWLLVIKNFRLLAQRELEDYFSTSKVLQSITVGESGFLVTINPQTGTVLTSPDSSLNGSNFKTLGLKADKEINSTEELLSLFNETDSITRLEVCGISCYAHKLNLNNIIVLVMLPIREVRHNANTATLILFTLLVFITGLAVLYAMIHVSDDNDSQEPGEEQEKGQKWNRNMAGKMMIVSALVVIAAFVGVVYLEALSLYADTFSYSQRKVSNLVDVLESDADALEKLQQWSNSESRTRVSLAKLIIQNTDPKKLDRDFMSDLAESLGVWYVYRIDKNGNTVVTNSSYDHLTIDKSSPLYPMLEGRPDYLGEPAEDSLFGAYLQIAAITVRGENDLCDGFIMIALNPSELVNIRENLNYSGVFNRLGLVDGTAVMVVKDNDMSIEYLAIAEDGISNSGIGAYEVVGMNIADLGLEANRLRDNYNGNMLLLNNTFFASVRRVDDSYYLVMRPEVNLSISNLAPALVSMSLTLLYMVVLVIISSRWKESDDDTKQVPEEEPTVEEANAKIKQEALVLSAIGKLFHTDNKYFDERWPQDSKKWKDRTSAEKFGSVSKLMLLAVLLFVFIHAKLEGSQSVWYYCINGVWDTGINLYSITTCVISVCVLVLIKLLIHKLFYFIARMSSAKGETICSLMDSFSSYALVIAGFFICLHNVGVNATALSLTGGVAGVIFGIGCKDLVSDILAGIIMTFEGIVHNGDYINAGKTWGTVLNIGIRTTTVKRFHEVVAIRNNDLKDFTNLLSEETARYQTYLTIDPSESLERVMEVIEKELPEMEKKLSSVVDDTGLNLQCRGIDQISLDGIVLAFAAYCKGTYFKITYAYNTELKLMCERNNIHLAKHQVVVSEPPKTK